MRKQLVLKEAFLFLLEFFYYIPAPVYYIIYLHQYVIFSQFFFSPLHTCTSRVIAHRLRHAIFPNNNVPSESVRLRESKKKNLKDSIQKWKIELSPVSPCDWGEFFFNFLDFFLKKCLQ